jgi:SNF2 family DNA or RNA helicase
MSYWEFQHHFMNETVKRFGDKIIRDFSGLRNIEELKSYLKGKYLRRKLKEFIDLPPIIRVNIKMEKHSKVDAELGRAWDMFNAGIKIEQSHFSTVKANAALAKTQFTYEYCRHLMQTGEGPLVVFSYHPAALEDLKNRFEGDNYKVGVIDGSVIADSRHDIKNAFQGGRLDMVLMSIGAGSVGFTLHAAKHVIFNDLSWVPGDNDQAEKRIYRIGQVNKCLSHRILGGPVDVRIVKALTEKMEVIKEIL